MMFSRAGSPELKQRLFPVVLAVAFAVTLGACGGSIGDGGSEPASSGNAAPTPADTVPVASSGDAPAPMDTDNGSEPDAGLTPNVCAFLKDLFHGSGGGPADLPPDQLMAVFGGLPDRAPAEIRDDVRVVADGFKPVIRLLQDLGVEHRGDIDRLSEPDQQRVQAAFTALGQGEVGAAQERVNYYLVGKKEC
jgi:hypothetical protein